MKVKTIYDAVNYLNSAVLGNVENSYVANEYKLDIPLQDYVLELTQNIGNQSTLISNLQLGLSQTNDEIDVLQSEYETLEHRVVGTPWQSLTLLGGATGEVKIKVTTNMVNIIGRIQITSSGSAFVTIPVGMRPITISGTARTIFPNYDGANVSQRGFVYINNSNGQTFLSGMGVLTDTFAFNITYMV